MWASRLGVKKKKNTSMKFEVSSSELLSQLQVSSGVIASTTVIPILEDFLFSLAGNKLTVTASNLETTIVSKLDVVGSENGEIAIPAKILLETLKALPGQPVSIIMDQETMGVTIKSSYGEYKLTGDNPVDFPELPKEVDTENFSLNSDTLNKAISNTLFATSNDEMRAAMKGVYAQVDFNKIIFVATDAHKLVRYTVGGIVSESTASFIVPSKSLALLKGALIADTDVRISHNATNAFFSFDDTILICRLIDAKYPDYNAVIPVDNPHTLNVLRKDFQNSLRRIAIYANKSTNQVIVNINDNSITISAQDLDFSNEATEVLSCTYDGEPMTIGFNAKFLGEMLGVLNTEEVTLNLSTPNRAGILLPQEQEDHEELMMLVMPVLMGS